MPVSICPRCQHVCPDYAIFCYFDGIALQAQQNASVHRLPGEFVFPSGRRCQTFDELAQGCQEEWTAARDLLRRGIFAQYFQNGQRVDLMRAANDARAQENPDIGLMTFLTALPGTRTQTPKLDLHPRRILLGTLTVGESKSVLLTLTNQGQGMLQGTVTVSEGQDWLSLAESANLHQVAVNAVRDQVVKLHIHTRGVAAGPSYGARLTVVTNGGVVEVPLRMELAAQPFARPPFQGVRTQRELAEKMRQQAKAAVPILESGEIQRWFAVNGWNYPVAGTPIKGVGGVQQFFEGMGLSKPPAVTLSQNELRFTCKSQETLRAQVTLQTKIRKWVYAHVVSDQPWLKVLNPLISGPQHASVPLEIDTHLWNQGPTGEGKVTFTANGGQKLTLKVVVEILGGSAIQKARPVTPPLPRPRATDSAANAFAAITAAPPAPVPAAVHAPSPRETTSTLALPARRMKLVPALVTTILLCLLLRLMLIPFVDMGGRSSVTAAAVKKLGIEPTSESPFEQVGGWLRLPWLPILAGSNSSFSAGVFQPGTQVELNALEFRHYFASYFIRWFVLRTWWVGALAGALLIWRRGGALLDMPWGIIAGAMAGLGFSATLAAFFLIAELLPHAIWHLAWNGQGGFGPLILWCLLALFCWGFVGILLGATLPWISPLRRLLIDPFQGLLARGFGLVGLKPLAEYWAPA